MQRIIKRLSVWAVIVAAILIIPLVLTLVGSGVDGEGFHWTLADFVVMGFLMFGTGLVYEFIRTKVRNTQYRAVIGVILAIAFLLVWAELAVGIFGSPFAGS